MAKSRISTFRLVVALLCTRTLTSALYFPQSDISLKIPYINENEFGLISDINLLTLKTLKNDSATSADPIYQIMTSKARYARLDEDNEIVILQALPEKGTSSAIFIQATDKSGAEAFLEVKIHAEAIKTNVINCTNYLQDMCFWNTSKYRIYENQPLTMLGTLGPDAYKSICPHFAVSRYELLNATDLVYVYDNKIYSNDSLDRDTLNPPKGTGPQADVNVRCVIWENTTGNQYTIDRVLSIDVLDQNDNPPIPQTNESVEIHLKDFTQGDRLDENDLIINDADNINTNAYSVQLLNDSCNALNLTYDIISIDHPKRPPSTAIYARLYSRTTLLPESPYRVILQVKDASLLSGYGNNTRNISLSFIGPQHHTTTTTTSVPLKQRVVYPEVVHLPRNSNQFHRIAQPLHKVNSKVVFGLPGAETFNVTSTGGIIFLANASLLASNSTSIGLRVVWRTPDQSIFSTTLSIKITESTEFCKQSQTRIHSCANAKTASECEGRCGVGSGNSSGNSNNVSGCVWRSNKASNSTMTEKYETCSPDLTFCPNSICDELEQLDPRICPQDCAIESEVRFAQMNKGGRGIHSGFSTCWCDDFSQCTCGASFLRTVQSSNGSKEARNLDKGKRAREGMIPQLGEADARKAAGSTCGPTCLIGIIAASLFVVIIIVGSFILWRYR